MDILSICADFLRKNVMFVAVAMITTTLAIYGIYIKKMVKNMTKNLNFLLRFAVYIFVYAFLLGFLSAQAVIFFAKILGGLANTHLILAVFLVFLALCFLARNENQI